MRLSSKIYEILKWISVIALPAFGTLYFVMSEAWNLPYGSQIQTTLDAVGTFIGTLICVSTYNYRKDLKSKEEIDNGKDNN